jgi:hypothetical protein
LLIPWFWWWQWMMGVSEICMDPCR